MLNVRCSWNPQPRPVCGRKTSPFHEPRIRQHFQSAQLGGGAVPFLVAGVLRVRLHRRQFPERLHLPDAAGLERRLAAVALSALQIRDSVLSQRAAADVALAARTLQELRRADLAALLRRGTADRPGVSRVLAGVRALIAPWLALVYCHLSRRPDHGDVH